MSTDDTRQVEPAPRAQADIPYRRGRGWKDLLRPGSGVNVSSWALLVVALSGSVALAALYCLSLYVQFGRLTVLNIASALGIGVLGAGLSSALYFIPNESWVKVVSPNFGFVAMGVLVVTYFYWHWYATVRVTEPSSDFYATVAQILPVFLLAALIDARQTRHANRWQAASYFAVIGIGEYEALLASAFGVHTPVTFAQVAAAVNGAIVGLLCALLAREEGAAQKPSD